MAYTKVGWQDLPSTSTPRNATNLGHMDDGIENNDKRLNGTAPMGNVVVDSIRSKNIFGNYILRTGYIVGTQLRIYSPANDRMAFIKCKPNTTYTISRSVITSSFRVSDYTSIPPQTTTSSYFTIPNAVENNTGTQITYTTSSSAKYLIIHYGNVSNDSASTLANSLASIQVEKGSTKTPFAPYQNLDNQEFYSTIETKIGTWVDGKPLYRRVFDNLTTPSNEATWTTLLTENSVYIDKIIDIKGYIDDGSNYYNTLNFGEGNYYVHTNAYRGNNNLLIRMIQKGWSSKSCYVILEYTKTTD